MKSGEVSQNKKFSTSKNVDLIFENTVLILFADHKIVITIKIITDRSLPQSGMHQAVPVLDNNMKITVLLYNSLLLMMELLNVNCHFLISCLVTPDTLTDMANQMTEKVGLVHGLPYVADRQGFAATLEQVSTVCVCVCIYMYLIHC